MEKALKYLVTGGIVYFGPSTLVSLTGISAGAPGFLLKLGAAGLAAWGAAMILGGIPA